MGILLTINLNMMKIAVKMLCIIFLLSLSKNIWAQESVDKGLQALVDDYKAVGLAVVVIKDNQPIYQKALGYKNLESQTPLRTDHLFRIASISKSFSATAIMQLVEKGLISLDDDFGDLMGFPIRNPKYPNQKITLRMVLSHTSSINDKNGYFELDVINPAKNPEWEKSYNDYAPGTNYEYCNLNFNMVGAVLERLTHQRFDIYIKDKVLRPLKLNAGYCIDSLDKANFATLYAYNSESNHFEAQPSAYNPRSEDIKKYRLGESTPVFSPTGGLKISAEDLATYMCMHMNYGAYAGGGLLEKKSAQLMQQKLSEPEGYGLALQETDTLIPNIHLVGHTGDAYGLFSNMFFHPEEKFGFVVITNGCIPKREDGNIALSVKVINYLYEQLIK